MKALIGFACLILSSSAFASTVIRCGVTNNNENIQMLFSPDATTPRNGWLFKGSLLVNVNQASGAALYRDYFPNVLFTTSVTNADGTQELATADKSIILTVRTNANPQIGALSVRTPKVTLNRLVTCETKAF